MRRVIHKQMIAMTAEFRLSMPQNAKVLYVATLYDHKTGGEHVWIWYSFHPDDYANMHWHNFFIAATGHPFNVANDDMYVGTFSLQEGEFIGHLYHCGAQEPVFKEPHGN